MKREKIFWRLAQASIVVQAIATVVYIVWKVVKSTVLF